MSNVSIRENYIDTRTLLAAARRQLPLIVLGAFLGAVLAALIIIASTPRYTAVQTVLLDEERADLLDQVSAIPNAARSDSAVRSELEILKSQALALLVVDELKLEENEDFMNPPQALISRMTDSLRDFLRPLLDLLSPADEPDPNMDLEAEDPDLSERKKAAAILRDRLEVTRIGRSFVIDISYTGLDPVRTVRIARAYGRAYRAFQLRSTTEVAEGALQWLEQRLALMERRSLEAAEAVQEFRRNNNLVSIRGDLLSDQQLADLTAQLIQAEADAASAGARLAEFRRVQSDPELGVLAAAVIKTDTASDPILADLRAQYLELAKRRGAVVERWGEEHNQAQRIERSMENIERQIGTEIDRAREALSAAFSSAQGRADALRKQIETLTGEEVAGNAPLGRLRQLEETAKTYSELYRDFLKRYEFATQQKTFPVALVQVISEAEIPLGATSPQKATYLAGGLFLGGFLAALLGAWRELREQPLRTRSDIADLLDLTFVGIVPRISLLRTRRKRTALADRAWHTLTTLFPREPSTEQPIIVGMAPLIGRPRSELHQQYAEFLAGRGRSVLLIDLCARPDRRNIGKQPAGPSIVREESGPDKLIFDEGDPALIDLSTFKWLFVLAQNDYDAYVVNLPPLAQSELADRLAPELEGVLLNIPWDAVPARLVQGALDYNPQFTARLVGAVFYDVIPGKLRARTGRGSFEDLLIRTNS